ncbi:MAG: acyl-homoserine-lactone synthase [Alphaproteobacteria bacterium]
MIDCVSIRTCHLFPNNPLCGQHQLRYGSIIKRQGWKVPSVSDMEYDQYDNPAAHYFVWSDDNEQVRGTSRLYPTDRPYMLQEVFPHLVTKTDLPQSSSIWEGSRFCVDASAPPELRKRIMQEIILGYLEFSLDKKIEAIIGVMFPAYWRSIFVNNGWNVEWIGEPCKSEEGHKIIAGMLPVSEAVLQSVREKTGIYAPVLSYGLPEPLRYAA